MGESQYSFSLTTFSPSGKLAQIEYALNAVAAGVTSLGIAATDGVVIATEKKLPSALVDEETVQKITVISPNIGVVYSGMGPDFRVLVRRARKTAQVGLCCVLISCMQNSSMQLSHSHQPTAAHTPVLCGMQAYFTLYKEYIPIAQLVRETAAVMQEFTRECPPGREAYIFTSLHVVTGDMVCLHVAYLM